MNKTAAQLIELIDSKKYPLAESLIPIVTGPVHWSSAGFPYLDRAQFEAFRDTMPWLLAGGHAVREAADHILAVSTPQSLSGQPALELALRVVRTVLNTAAITAPPDLWLLRQVLATLQETGVLEPLLNKQTISPTQDSFGLDSSELMVDLSFLMSRGYLLGRGDTFSMASHPRAEAAFRQVQPIPHGSLTQHWTDFFQGKGCHPELLDSLASFIPVKTEDILSRSHWMASWSEIEIGFRLVPVVLAIQRAGWVQEWVENGTPVPAQSETLQSAPGKAVCQLLYLSGMTHTPSSPALTAIGKRVLERGPGPFGIIEAYHPYMTHLREILREGRGKTHVSRTANVAASQLANSRSFEQANNSLDRFCNDTGFEYRVFIEHALGRGEATRQRFERDGYDRIYVGADLEDASIESAQREQAQERLPATMHFVSGADIGQAENLIGPLTNLGIDPHGAVMVVGNGFHEVRGQTDERVVDVFRKYHDAGILLIFTEESALSVANLLETAWNTYHAGFKYVHERSGQGLRPAREDPCPSEGPALPASWNRCATNAGYVCAEAYSRRTRTIFPYRPSSGFNPAISVTHFFVPGPIAKALGLSDP